MRTDRLLQLADHLEHGKLGHEHFNYGSFNTGKIGKNLCGSLGCAIGECPIVFPEHWEFRQRHDYTITPMPILKITKLQNGIWAEDTLLDASVFFDVSLEKIDYLFLPFGGKGNEKNTLGFAATRYEVAQHIRNFVERHQS